MRYASARYKQYRQQEAYRIFVTEGLRMIAYNTSAPAHDGGMEWLTKSYSDIIHGGPEPQTLKPGDAKEKILRKIRGD